MNFFENQINEEKVKDWVQSSLEFCTHIKDTQEAALKAMAAVLAEAYQGFNEAEIRWIREFFGGGQFTPNDLLYVLSILSYWTDIPDFWEYALTVQQGMNFNAYISAMLELQIVGRLKGSYAGRRRLHQRNVDKFRELLQADESYIPLEKRNRRRIVLMTEQLLDLPNAPARTVLSFAYALQEKLGYEVLIFACPSNYGVPQEVWEYGMAMNALENYRYAPIRVEFHGTVFKGWQLNMNPDEIKEYYMMLSLIHEWNPWFVFQLGILNPVADLVNDFTTVAAKTMSACLPVSEAEIFIQSGESEDRQEFEAMETGQKMVEIDPFPVIFEKSEKVYCKEELGLPQDRFLIAVVGNRLEKELDQEFLMVMKNILERLPSADFVIIGEASELEEAFSEPVFENRVYCLGYCWDLAGVYQVLDLYVNPKRKGGGHSSNIALLVGLPVVTLPKCDVAGNVGEAFVVENYKEMTEAVCRYCEDMDYYESRKSLAVATAEGNSEVKLVDGVRNMLEQIEAAMEQK